MAKPILKLDWTYASLGFLITNTCTGTKRRCVTNKQKVLDVNCLGNRSRIDKCAGERFKMVKLGRIGLLSLLLVATFVGLGLWLSKQPKQFASDEFKEILTAGSWGRIGKYSFPPGGSYGFVVRFNKDGTYKATCPDGDVSFSSAGIWDLAEDSYGQLHLQLDETRNFECSMMAFDGRVLYLEMSGQLVLVGENDAKSYLEHITKR